MFIAPIKMTSSCGLAFKPIFSFSALRAYPLAILLQFRLKWYTRREGGQEDNPGDHQLATSDRMRVHEVGVVWDILVLTESISPHQKQYNSKEEAEDEWTSQVSVVHDCLVSLLNRV